MLHRPSLELCGYSTLLSAQPPLIRPRLYNQGHLCRETGMLTFESDEVRLRKFREKLRQMSDKELIDYGRRLGRIPKRVSGVADTFNQLAEARAEWRRRHPLR